MKNTCGIKKIIYKIIMSVACLCPGIIFLSCGLDDYPYLYEPTVYYNMSYYTSASNYTVDYNKWYVDFLTNDNENYKVYTKNKSEFTFSGTEIYYKIYNNYSTLASQRSAILAVNTSSNSTAAATKMIDTYGYKPLGMYPSVEWSPFVEASSDGSNQRIALRIKDYTSGEVISDSAWSTKSCIYIRGFGYLGYYQGKAVSCNYDGADGVWKDSSGNTVTLVKPFRNGNSKSFDFFDDQESNNTRVNCLPVSGDDDYCHSSSASDSLSGDKEYYVQFFAVSTGYDGSYTNFYSLVLNLGTIPVIENQ